MWSYVAIGIGAAVAGKLIWMIDDWGRDWTTNHAEFSPSSEDPMLRPIEMDADLDRVESVLRNWTAGQSAWAIVPPASDPPSSGDPISNDRGSSDQDSSMKRIHLTHRTPVFRFVDDVVVELTPINPTGDGGPRTRVDATSRSRVGRGDLGQNPRNLRALRAGITSAQ